MNKGGSNKSGDWLVYSLVLLGSAVLIFASLYFEHHPYAADYIVALHFTKELGIAGIISLIVIFTVEKFSRKNHEKAAHDLVEKINSDLFYAIYKRYIPKEVFAEVEKCLMQGGVFRRGHEVNYTIDNIDENTKGVDYNKHVTCLADCRYTLHNITEREIEHTVVLMLERPIDRLWDSHCKINAVRIDGKKLEQEEINNCTTKNDAQVFFKKKVKILPNSFIEVSTSATLLKQKTDSEIWVSRLPSDGIRLTVSIPSKDIQVFAKAHHSELLVGHIDNAVTKTWELKHGMFPFQSIVFWWHSI